MNDDHVSVSMKKIDLMAARIAQDWASRDWETYADDHLYTEKAGYIKRHWKWFDKYLFLESGRFEHEVTLRLGFDAYRSIKKHADETRRTMDSIVPKNLIADRAVESLIYMLQCYLFSWAPSDAYSETAIKIYGAFPKQGIVCGFAGNVVDGQMIVYRPVLPPPPN